MSACPLSVANYDPRGFGALPLRFGRKTDALIFPSMNYLTLLNLFLNDAA